LVAAGQYQGNLMDDKCDDLKSRFLPFLCWVGELKKAEVLRADLIAGITVALVLIPQSMAYAQLAGLPPYYGLYASFLPGIIAALFGSSRQLATGPVAVVSLMTASALEPIAGANPELYLAYAIMLALMVGVFQIALGLLRLGVLVNFLSHPVVIGFTNAAAIIIGTSQLGKLFGVSVEKAEHTYETVFNTIVESFNSTHMETMLMAIVALSIMIAMKRWTPRAPNVLTAVVITTLISWLVGFKEMGGAVVGSIPTGLPPMSVPSLDFQTMGQLLSVTVAIAIIGFMEAISIAKAMAAKTRGSQDAPAPGCQPGTRWSGAE
jgi:SulP family sulfate permease